MKVLVILGAAVWAGGRPSPTLRRRTAAAAARWRAGGFDLIIPSGGLGRHGPSEAEAMRRLLMEQGVGDAAIRLEDQALTTIETAWLVADLLRGQSAEVTAVTDLTHCPRAWLAFRATGHRARMVSASAAAPAQGWRQWLRQGARECLGLPYYALRLALNRRWGHPRQAG